MRRGVSSYTEVKTTFSLERFPQCLILLGSAVVVYVEGLLLLAKPQQGRRREREKRL